MYAGSFLLSYLLSGAIEELDRQSEDVEIMFPSRYKDTNIPNRLVAVVKGYGPAEQEKLGRTLARYVQDHFIQICKAVFRRSGVTPNRWAIEQVERFLEVYWVFAPLERYESSYKQLIQNINSIKRLRGFTQSNEFYGRKCAIYPEYNPVFVKRTREGKFPNYVVPDHAVDVSRVPACMYALNPGEGLSAIVFVKRMLHLLNEPEAGEKAALKGYQLNMSSVLDQSLLCSR
ncbi:VirB4 component [Paenibacillus popilliae ATCC 14706]|uniref:VirB4 component n=1 Tax=Paenibacillus popilliae ATCC 14706 TaxID=1212764 RepID=M9L826_PAEPP|nr:VirB4 component [Paenibacillus popilliae ATCC 14706]